MFDHNPSAFGQTMTPEELLEAMAKIDPQIANAARVVRGSVSAGVHRVGEEPLSGKGFHIYFAVEDASDFPRYTNTMHERLQLAGFGYIVITGNGVMKARSCIDTCVASPERLIFEGQPVIQDDRLTYSAPEPEFMDGALLDTKALPDLTPAERAELVEWETAEKKKSQQPAADAQKLVWLDNYVAKQIDRGMSPDEARAKGEACQTMGDNLYGDFILQFKNRGDVTVAEVLENPPLYNGQPCVDLRELRGSYPADSAWFYWNDGSPIIRSFGHGGAIFHLYLKEPKFEQPRNNAVAELLANIKNVNLTNVCQALGWTGGANASPQQKHVKVALVHTLIETAEEHNLHIVHDDGFFHIYNGTYWEVLEDSEVKQLLKNAAIKMGYTEIECRDAMFVDKLFDQTIQESFFAGRNSTKESIINLMNGSLVLSESGIALKPFDYRDFIKHQLDFEYDPEARNDTFLRYLEQVLPDADTRKTLQQIAGFLFIRGLKMEQVFFLYGTGSNGKSVFF
ncbi:MAG: hypothetical protein ACXWAT_02450 [Methylobacter sp.]